MSTIAGQQYVKTWSSGYEVVDHPNAVVVANQIYPLDLVRVPESTVVLPALKDLYPEEDASTSKEKAVRGVACRSPCISTLSKLFPRARVNTRARVEMLQHQLTKPFRAGKKIVTRTGAMQCFKEKEIDNMQNTSGEVSSTEEDVSSNDDFPQIAGRSRRNNYSTSARQGGVDGKTDEYEVKVLGGEDEEGTAQEFGARDRHSLYSCSLWPDNSDTVKDPPGHFYNTKKEEKIHFYNEISVEKLSLKEKETYLEDIRAPLPTVLPSKPPEYSPSYLEDATDDTLPKERLFITRNRSNDTSDSDRSVFVLEDGLD